MTRMLLSLLVVGLVGLLAAVVFGSHLLPARNATGHHAATTDPGPLKGSWVCVSQETDGEASPPDKVGEKLRLIVRGDELLFANGGKETRMAYALDPAVNPKTIDLWEKQPELHGVTPIHRGIFSIEGDTLIICSGLCRISMCDDRTAISSESERPTEFTAGPNSYRMLTVYKRQGP